MHELTICLNILDILRVKAEQENFQRIKKIWLEIGNLAGIEVDALQFNFSIAALGTVAENAVLEIIPVVGEAWCHSCQKPVTLKSYLDSCLQCGQYNYQIIAGKESRVVKMEVE